MISELYPEDTGIYTCVLKNSSGTATASAELKVVIKESEATDYHGRKSRLNSFSDAVCWSGVPPIFTDKIGKQFNRKMAFKLKFYFYFYF